MILMRSRPPLYDEISNAFDVVGKPVLFAWGDVIYAPVGVDKVAPHLEAHESVHGRRQKEFSDGNVVENIVSWWRRYLSDAEFRLEEEKLGHAAEYGYLCKMFPSRNDRRRHLSLVASRLSNPLYRYRFTKDQAKRYLSDGDC